MPVGAARFTVGIQLGGLGEWVQVEDAVFHDVEVFGKPGKKGPTVPAQLIHEGMEETAPGLFRCSGNALTLAPPPTGTGDQAMLLALVFRPVVWRSEARELRRAACRASFDKAPSGCGDTEVQPVFANAQFGVEG